MKPATGTLVGSDGDTAQESSDSAFALVVAEYRLCDYKIPDLALKSSMLPVFSGEQSGGCASFHCAYLAAFPEYTTIAGVGSGQEHRAQPIAARVGFCQTALQAAT